MAGESLFTVKSGNPHPIRIDLVKFDGKKNFGMWRCEVMDALTVLIGVKPHTKSVCFKIDI